jgi:hydrogenase expression/formation protein HypC
MCVAVPGQIVQLSPDRPETAEVWVEGVTLTVNVLPLTGAELAHGDWILIHAGLGLARISETEAREILSILREIDEVDAAEMAEAFASGGAQPPRN